MPISRSVCRVEERSTDTLMCEQYNAEREPVYHADVLWDCLIISFNEYKTNRIIIATLHQCRPAAYSRSLTQLICFGRKVLWRHGKCYLCNERLDTFTFEIEQFRDRSRLSGWAGSADHNREAGGIHGSSFPYGCKHPWKENSDPNRNDTVFSSSNRFQEMKAVSQGYQPTSWRVRRLLFQDVHVSGHACGEEIKLYG